MRSADAPEATKSVTEAMKRSGAQQDFQTIATLGFATASGLFDINTSATLKQGLDRLAGRQPFVDEVPMAFCSDAVGILGVALGTKFLADISVSTKIVTWLSSFLKNIYHLDGTENWQRCFFQAADRVLGGSIGLASPLLDQTADVYLALIAKGIFVPASGKTTEQEDERGPKLILLQGTHPDSLRACSRQTCCFGVRSALCAHCGSGADVCGKSRSTVRARPRRSQEMDLGNPTPYNKWYSPTMACRSRISCSKPAVGFVGSDFSRSGR